MIDCETWEVFPWQHRTFWLQHILRENYAGADLSTILIRLSFLFTFQYSTSVSIDASSTAKSLVSRRNSMEITEGAHPWLVLCHVDYYSIDFEADNASILIDCGILRCGVGHNKLNKANLGTNLLADVVLMDCALAFVSVKTRSCY